MALLPSDPKQQKALGAIVVALGLGYAFYTYWYTPQRVELDDLASRVETLETRNRQAQIQAARGGTDLEERNALYERHVMELEELIPRGEEVPTLIETITRQAQAVGVDVTNMAPEPDQPGEFYVRQGWSMQTIGEYHDVARFLTSIASLPRIITPVDVDVATYRPAANIPIEYESPIVVTFRMETYVLPETAGAPPPEVGPGSPGGGA
jgi:type IV pilus assembly protein PilO